MIINENLSEELFNFWKSKTNIAIDLDLLLEDFKYQASFSLGKFFIESTHTKSGLIEFFFYDFEILENETILSSKKVLECSL